MFTYAMPEKVLVDTSKEDIKIFVIDDDVSYLYALGFYLTRYTNYKIFCYRTGEEGLKYINKLHPEIVILDYYLNKKYPDAMDGLHILKQIKKINTKTKIIMISAQESLTVALDALKTGAYTYILKDEQALYSLKKYITEICEGIRDENTTNGIIGENGEEELN